MSFSVYEQIQKDHLSKVNAFVAPIRNSTFHWHREYELIGILEGTITEKVETEEITLHEGDLLLVNSNVIHTIRSQDDGKNLCMIIQLPPELFQLDDSVNEEVRFYINSTEAETEGEFAGLYKRMARIAKETMSNEKYAPFRVRAEVCTLIAELFDHTVHDIRYRNQAVYDAEEVTVRVIELIHLYLQEDRLVERICHEMGSTRKTLERAMQTVIGSTMKEVIDSMRLEKAKELLKHTDYSMNYILDTCGFGSEKTFYRMFKKETQMTPREFRQQGYYDTDDGELRGYLKLERSKADLLLDHILS